MWRLRGAHPFAKDCTTGMVASAWPDARTPVASGRWAGLCYNRPASRPSRPTNNLAPHQLKLSNFLCYGRMCPSSSSRTSTWRACAAPTATGSRPSSTPRRGRSGARLGASVRSSSSIRAGRRCGWSWSSRPEASGTCAPPLRRGRSQGITSLELSVQAGDGYRPITSDTVTATQAHLHQLINMDYDTFVNSAFLLQGRADLLTMATPTQRKEVLGRCWAWGSTTGWRSGPRPKPVGSRADSMPARWPWRACSSRWPVGPSSWRPRRRRRRSWRPPRKRWARCRGAWNRSGARWGTWSAVVRRARRWTSRRSASKRASGRLPWSWPRSYRGWKAGGRRSPGSGR